MRKHKYIKSDCNCERRATYFTCRHCGAVEYAGTDELRHMETLRATCTSLEAPVVQPAEKFRSGMGGSFDCLAPDYSTGGKE